MNKLVEKYLFEKKRSGGAKKAYDMGFDHGVKPRPKLKNPESSFGPYAQDYQDGYSDGVSSRESQEWHEDQKMRKYKRV